MPVPFFRVAQVAFQAFAQSAFAKNFFNSLQSLGVNVKTKGGRKLNQFINNAENPERYAKEAAKALRRQWLPRVRSNSPFLTGRLRAELRITQRGVRVELRGPFYARVVRWRPVPSNPQKINMRIVASRELRRLPRSFWRNVGRKAYGI